MIKLRLTAEEIRQSWLLKAWDRDEASKLGLLPAGLTTVLNKLFSNLNLAQISGREPQERTLPNEE